MNIIYKSNKKTNRISCEYGFALVEILVAMIVLFIIIFAFTGLFTSSFSGIFEAGSKSKSLFNAQGSLEQKIAENVEGTGQTIQIYSKTVYGKRLVESPFTTFLAESPDRVRFVSVGNTGTIITSTDGINWNTQSSGTNNYLKDVIWGGFSPGMFLAVGLSGTILKTVDGVNWIEINGQTDDFYGVAWGGPENDKKFVVVGYGRIITSQNGTDWSNSSFYDNSLKLNDISWGNIGNNGLFVAVGDNGIILTSVDGINWTQTSVTSYNLHNITWGDNKFVIVGDNQNVIYSTDGNDWHVASDSASGINIYGVTWGKDKFIAVGESNSGGITQGIICRIDFDQPEDLLQDIIYPTNKIINDATWSYHQFIAVGNQGIILTSANGLSWNTETTETTNNLYGIASGDTNQ